MGAAPMFAFEVGAINAAHARKIIEQTKGFGAKFKFSDKISCDGKIQFGSDEFSFKWSEYAGNEYVGNAKTNSLVIGHYTNYSEPVTDEFIVRLAVLLKLKQQFEVMLKKNLQAYTCAFTI